MIRLWLDDVRPMPPFFTHHAKTVEEAQALLRTGEVVFASLDHDLGACADCLANRQFDGITEMPNCDHFGTGYTLVCWMEETGFWPSRVPNVHSANASGAERMRLAIKFKFPRYELVGPNGQIMYRSHSIERTAAEFHRLDDCTLADHGITPTWTRQINGT